MLRNVVLSVATLVLGLTVSVSAAAAATTSTAQCDAMLGDVEIARVAVDQLETSLADMDTERGEHVRAIASLEQKIAAAQQKGRAIMTLRAELDAHHLELSIIDDLRPEIVAQLDALRTSIDATERGYIACIETIVAGG